MATRLGRVVMRPRGAYSSGATYEMLDVVLYNGSSYVFVADTPASGKVPTDTTYWAMLASKGDAGDGSGDMLKAIYDANADNIIDLTAGGTGVRATTSAELLAGIGAAPAARKYAGLDLSADRSVTDVVRALFAAEKTPVYIPTFAANWANNGYSTLPALRSAMGATPATRKIGGVDLSADRTLSDIGAFPSRQIQAGYLEYVLPAALAPDETAQFVYPFHAPFPWAPYCLLGGSRFDKVGYLTPFVVSSTGSDFTVALKNISPTVTIASGYVWRGRWIAVAY